jgi:hypothetical protein
MAEEYIAKKGTIETNGKVIQVKDFRNIPTFDVKYDKSQDVIKIKSSAGNVVLKKENSYYSCYGLKKGFYITFKATVYNGKIDSIVYEEREKNTNVKIILIYYKK